MALMDIVGKLVKAPAHQVLGGPTRNKARALAPLHGSNQAQLAESLEKRLDAGLRSVSVPLILPPGPTKGRRFYRDVRRLLEQLRKVSEGKVDFVLDCGGQLSPAEATLLAQELETFHLLWLDEPCGTVQNAALAGVSEETVTPIGLGRGVYDNSEFQDYLRLGAVDVLRPDIRRWGVTPLRKVAALAETYYVAIAPRHSGGPIATAAALQVAAAIPNFYLVEIPLPLHDDDLQMRRQLAGNELENVKDGFLALPQGSGLGLQVNRDMLERYKVDL